MSQRSTPEPQPTRLDADAVVSFGTCQIDVARHELRRDGRVVAIPPKVFDLLAVCISRRGRLIPKSEFVDAVWGGAPVTDNVIARTVMKARQAIGDTSPVPTLLKTVHRLGYVFAANARAADPNHPVLASARGATRLAVLPARNATGDPDHDWLAWGLAGLVEEALGKDSRLAVISSSNVSAALDGLPKATATSDLGTTVADLLGAAVVIEATIRRSSPGRLFLEWRTGGDVELAGRVRAATPYALATQLARAVDSALFPGDRCSISAEFRDPLAGEAFGRAIEFAMHDNWRSAARLLEVVLDLEPQSTAARLHFVRALASLLDARAFDVGEALLKTAAQREDVRLVAATHEALGRAYLVIEGDGHAQKARRHMDEALTVVALYASEEWAFRTWFGQAVAAQITRDYARAGRFYELAWRNNESAGSPFRRAGILTNRAIIELNAGSVLLARDFAEQALEICLRHGLASNATEARVHLAFAEAGLGFFERADAQCERAMATLPELPAYEAECAAWVLFLAADLDSEFPEARRYARAAETLSSTASSLPERVRGVHLAAQSMAAAAQALPWRQVDAAMTQAVDLAVRCDHLENAHIFVSQWLRLAMRHAPDSDRDRLDERIRNVPRAAENVYLQDQLVHASAHRSRRLGNAARAFEELHTRVRAMPLGAVGARASLDAAWMALDQGDAALAQTLARDLGPWLRHHPAGLAVAARLMFVQGHREEAVELQQSCDELLAQRPTDHSNGYARHYADLSADAHSFPLASRLPTLLL